MIKTSKKGKIGFIKLSRPQALNAMNSTMVKDIKKKLIDFEKDQNIRAVVFEAEENFSAGGDLKEIYYDYLTNENVSDKAGFFKKESLLNEYLIGYKKPIISFLTGLVMGAGAGLSIHSDLKIADETVTWAMPEVSLGFVPDLCVGYYLSKLPRALGQYLGITGRSLGGYDLVKYGLADIFIKKSDYPQAKKILIDLSEDLKGDELVKSYKSRLKDLKAEGLENIDLDLLEKYFLFDRPEEIIKSLKEDKSSEFARDLLGSIKKLSPLMVKVQFKKYFYGKNLTKKQTLDLDMKIMEESIRLGDMSEGIRAKMIEKDNKADFTYKSLASVEDSYVEDLVKI